MSFSPDRRMLAAALRGTVTVWKLREPGSESLSYHAPVNVIRFSRNGQKLLTIAEDGTVRVLDAEHFGTSTTFNRTSVLDGAISPDGNMLALTDMNGTVELTDVSGRLLRTLVRGGGATFGNLQFSPDGGRLIAGGTDGAVRLWTVAGGPVVVIHSGPVAAATISTSEKVGTLSKRGVLGSWTLSGMRQRSMGVGSYELGTIAPDGHHVALGAGDGSVSVVDDLGDSKRVLGTHPGGGITAMTFTADGRSLATAAEGDALIRVWDLGAAPLALSPGSPFYADQLAFSPDGSHVAGFENSGSDVALWPSAGGPRTVLHNGQAAILALGFNRTSTEITTVAADGIERRLPKTGGTPSLERGGLGSPSIAALSSDSSLIATAEDNGPLRIWRSGRVSPITLEPRISNVSQIAFSPDGRQIAVTNQTRGLSVWNTTGGAPIRLKAPDFLDHASFSPAGGSIAAGSEGTGSVYLWPRITDGTKPTLLGRHLHFLNAVSFDPAGGQVACGGDDGLLRLWNLDGGASLALPSEHAIVDALAFDREGTRIATSDTDGNLGLLSCDFCGPIASVISIGRAIEDAAGVS